MSAAHDAHADASAGHHDAHDHFDNEPVTELGADEPRTPNWVPYLGLALFFSAGLACLLCSDDDKPATDKAVAAEAAPTAAAVQELPQARPMPAQPGMQMPPGHPGGALPNGMPQLAPEQAREMQQRLQAIQAQQQNAGQPTPPQPGLAPRPVGTPPPVPAKAPLPVPAKAPAKPIK